ncbi:hypothetical protein H4P12_12390 [Paracoccus sp. 11-3]|uniref:Uncharacterized protein n=1 Tax=Paracoccus amoyensis TaxID=2760093 RepID=A0A926GCJ4_9RHOB|nr:hypothetical protein [Paracoccus amoyensis]
MRRLRRSDHGRNPGVSAAIGLSRAACVQQTSLSLNMADISHHSPLAHAAYHDLLRSQRDEAVGDLRGTPTRVTRNGRVYW